MELPKKRQPGWCVTGGNAMKKAFLVFLSAVLACSTVACKAECQHVYDSDLDAVCNECGEVREVAQSVGLSMTEGEGSALGVNEAVASLDYDAEEVLAFEGNAVGSVTPKSGVDCGDAYVVVTREAQMVASDFDLAVNSANLDVTYPGALLLANSKLFDDEPQSLTVDRGSVVLTLDLPGMTQEGTRVVSEASYANVSSAMNDTLDKWYAQYGGKFQMPANMSYVGAPVRDEKSLQLQLDCNVSFLKQVLPIDFDAVASRKKSAYIVRYKQVYYTASIDAFTEPADAFGDAVAVDDLYTAGMSDENPPAYVKRVTYGRDVYVVFESSAREQDLIALVEASMSKSGMTITPEVNRQYGDVIENTKVSVVAFGGYPEHVAPVALNQDTAWIRSIILNNVELSADNPAFPLSYEIAFLKDNSVAQCSGSSEYVVETYEEHAPGTICLEHSGAYTARFTVSWDEITGYDGEGNEMTVRREWDQNDEDKTAGFKAAITLAGNCCNINIKVRGGTGLVWEPWRTTLDAEGLGLVPERVVGVWGTSLNQKVSCSP